MTDLPGYQINSEHICFKFQITQPWSQLIRINVLLMKVHILMNPLIHIVVSKCTCNICVILCAWHA